MSRRAYVYRDGKDGPDEVGIAYFHETRGGVTTTFHYADTYLARRDAYPIDPDLMLTAGPQPVAGLPGAFQDCAPDRWGRNLITKHHRQRARAKDAVPGTLTDVDYLLGVSDETRQGALRFSKTPGGPFVAEHGRVPKTVSLPRLQAAADIAASDDEDQAAIKELLSAGSGSLGGARPKASVRADDGRLLIAKFSHVSDEWSVISWEMTALDLAEQAGITAPTRRLVTVAGRPALLLDRFDRAAGGRIGYISAMTATGHSDGDHGDYLDVAEAIEGLSGDFARDRLELFRRVVFNVAIHNTDDHLRNHGLLRVGAGWRLSPVFDVNPRPELAQSRVTSIAGETSAEQGVAALQDFGNYLSVSGEQAQAIVSEVVHGVAGWAETARSNQVPEQEVRVFTEVFDHQLSRLQHLLSSWSASPALARSASSAAKARRPGGTPGGGQFAPRQASSPP